MTNIDIDYLGTITFGDWNEKFDLEEKVKIINFVESKIEELEKNEFKDLEEKVLYTKLKLFLYMTKIC